MANSSETSNISTEDLVVEIKKVLRTIERIQEKLDEMIENGAEYEEILDLQIQKTQWVSRQLELHLEAYKPFQS
jgi:flagellar biosynthesis chaperone FliJ